MIVVFADHARAHIIAPVVELLFHLVFDELAFFFHHQNFVQAQREFTQRGRLEWPRHADFHQAYTDFSGVAFVDAQIFQRLQGIEVAFSGRDNAKTRLVAIDGDAVQFVDAAIGERCVNLVVLQTQFLLQRRIGPAQ